MQAPSQEIPRGAKRKAVIGKRARDRGRRIRREGVGGGIEEDECT